MLCMCFISIFSFLKLNFFTCCIPRVQNVNALRRESILINMGDEVVIDLWQSRDTKRVGRKKDEYFGRKDDVWGKFNPKLFCVE